MVHSDVKVGPNSRTRNTIHAYETKKENMKTRHKYVIPIYIYKESKWI